MMPNTTTLSSGMVTTKISAAREFTVKAMTMAPITTNGLRRNRRKKQVQAALHLIHVAGHTGDQGAGAEGVHLGKAQGLDVLKQGVAQAVE